MKWYLYYIVLFVLNIFFFSVISLSIYRLVCSIELSTYTFESVYTTDSFYYIYHINDLFSCMNVLYENIYEYSSSFYNHDWACVISLNIVYIYDVVVYSISSYYMSDTFSDSYLKILFFTKITTLASKEVLFMCLQDYVYCTSNETVLVFFRLINYSSNSFECLTIYLVYPYQFSLVLNKLQCFCFGSLILGANELLELPVIFFLSDISGLHLTKLYFFYLLLFN